jgi:hypothetical protein
MGQDNEVARRSISNEMLIKYADLSPNEIAEKTGFTPLEAAKRLTDLLGSRDWLSDRLEERKLIIQMQDVVRDTQERLSNASDDNYAAIANVVLRGLNSIGARFDSRRKLTEVDINEITAAQARTFGRAFDAALNHIIDGLEKDYPELDMMRVGQLQREGMQKAKEVVEEKLAE